MASPTRAVRTRKPKPEEIEAAADLIPALDDPSLFANRELSLIEFQRRVLDEARDPSNPLLERVKFLAIVDSNVSEMFMVRVAALKKQVEASIGEGSADGMTPQAQLTAIRPSIIRLEEEIHQCFSDQLQPELAEAGIDVSDYNDLNDRQRKLINAYFAETIFPVLTPLAFDPGRPFPHISNLSLNLAVLIRDPQGIERFARVKVPDTLPQLVPIHRVARTRTKSGGTLKHYAFVWLEQVISANLQALFPGMEILEAHPFHVTRDAEMAIQELEADDLLETIEEGVRQRRFGEVVRLQVNSAMPSHILEILMSNFEIKRAEIYRVVGPLDMSRLMSLNKVDRPDLKDAPFLPQIPPSLDPKIEEEDMFTAIRREPVLLHHPFDSFQPVVDFLQKAARDPDVLAIKMTLYRVGRNSPVVRALLEAQEEGKQVAVLVELKARFDEESNIEWARALEREGVHVVYGLLGLKIHSKVTQVVRREENHIRRYIHLGTGNYNAVTAHSYTDFGLLMADEDIGGDTTDLFNYLTGYSAKTGYRKLLVAPINLRQRLSEFILREIEHQKNGAEGRLIFKMNALVDKDIIQLLYRASQAGVRIDLLVRGICCLRPGVKGVSENIRVTSIVGQFLEHSRIYYFANGGEEQIYLGSADLMPRNLDRRVEVLFPLESAKQLRYIRDEVLDKYLADNVKARRMKADGSYERVKRGAKEPEVNSQAFFLGRGRRTS